MSSKTTLTFLATVFAMAMLFATLANNKSATAQTGVTSTPPNVMLRVVRVTEDWMPYASTGGWTQAVILKESETLKFYEAAIWEETASVHLYEFPNDYDWIPHRMTDEEKIAYREQFLVKKYTDMPQMWTDERSDFLKSAFSDFASYLVSRHPSSDHHLMYSGHGGPGGKLFGGQLKPADANEFLKSWSQSLGKPLGVVDMGGPCNKGSFADLANFCEHTRYFVASDLPNGGYRMDDWTSQKYHETEPETQYHNLLSSSESLEEALIGRIDLKRKAYEYSRNYMVSNRVEQANYLYSCDEFLEFGSKFKDFLEEVDSDYQITDDLHQFMVGNGANNALIDRFNDVVVHSADNKDFFEWDVVANGMLMPHPSVSSVPTPPPQPPQTADELLDRYDADESSQIDLSEVSTAIDDYFRDEGDPDKLTLPEVSIVIDLYFA